MHLGISFSYDAYTLKLIPEWNSFSNCTTQASKCSAMLFSSLSSMRMVPQNSGQKNAPEYVWTMNDSSTMRCHSKTSLYPELILLPHWMPTRKMLQMGYMERCCKGLEDCIINVSQSVEPQALTSSLSEQLL